MDVFWDKSIISRDEAYSISKRKRSLLLPWFVHIYLNRKCLWKFYIYMHIGCMWVNDLWHHSFVCFKSLFLAHPDLSSSLLTSTDELLLKSIRIDTIDQLSTTSADEIVDKAVTHVKEFRPASQVDETDVNLLKKRVNLWKMEADMLLSKI